MVRSRVNVKSNLKNYCRRLVSLILLLFAGSTGYAAGPLVGSNDEPAKAASTETAQKSALPAIEFNKIPYSIFSDKRILRFDGRRERDALPEFKTIPGLAPGFTNATGSAPAFDTWHRSHGDDFSSKYSQLDQINRSNVKLLKPAWVYHSSDTRVNNVEANPIVAGRTIFVPSTGDFLLSIDAVTGHENWRTGIVGAGRRGILWWPGNGTVPPRIFVPSYGGTYAINPDDGSRVAAFGIDGRVGGGSLIAPVVDGRKLIVAEVPPSVKAYDVETGELLWNTDLLKESNSILAGSAGTNERVFRIGGGVPWSGMSLDRARSRLFVSTGNPRPALYGATRPGNNELSSSIVSLDTETGKIVWSFQEVSHDLWDFDVPSPPILTTIHRNGVPIDVVAAVTKIGNTILLERDGGKPVFDYRLKKAPVSDVPDEYTSPYQPSLELPEPFMKRVFERNDVTGLSEMQKRSVEAKLSNARFGLFEPPSFSTKVALFGLHGGGEWPGGAVDPSAGILYVPSNQYPWRVRLRYGDGLKNDIAVADPKGDALYQSKCGGCHGKEREGLYESELIGDKTYPSLVGASSYLKFDGAKQFRKQHRVTPVAPAADDLETIHEYLRQADKLSDARGSLGISGVWQLLLDLQGYPGSKPPWGSIAAIDLNTGRKLWQVPFGEYSDLSAKGVPITGQPNFGGLFVSRGGLVFATGTIDRKIRAFDAATGKQLWDYELPAAGSAPPSTYQVDGTQYVVVVATGGLFAGFKEHSDTVMAFKLASP